jgi:uncharacterized cupredoxin-like copper-binding protein
VKSKGKWILAAALVPLLALALLAAACGGEDGDTEAGAEAETEVGGEAREIVVVAKEFGFEPSDITVKEGELIRIVLQNEGTVEHDWQVRGLHAQIMEEMDAADGHDHTHTTDGPHVFAAPGHTEHVEFIAEESGAFEIMCTVVGHAESGMVGTLTVE